MGQLANVFQIAPIFTLNVNAVVVIPNRPGFAKALALESRSEAMNVAVDQIVDTHLGTELSETEARELSSIMSSRELQSGDFLIEEGSTDDALHVIVKGNLEVVKRTAADGMASIAVIRERHLAGELSFIDGSVHTVGLRALSDSTVISLPREAFEKIVNDNPQIVYKVMRAVARSSHKIMHQMNHEFIELNNYIFKQHGRY
jgi:CRP-like cAMP-binding protein